MVNLFQDKTLESINIINFGKADVFVNGFCLKGSSKKNNLEEKDIYSIKAQSAPHNKELSFKIAFIHSKKKHNNVMVVSDTLESLV